MNFVCHPFTRVGQHRVMMLFLFLACAVAMQMSQWNVFDFSAVSSVPSSCVPWDEVRGRKHFACPPSVRMPSGAKLVVSDVGALMMQERVASMSRQTSSPSPFFDLFRTFDEINGQLLAWKNANPTVMNISVIGTTYEGRNISLVTVAKSQNLPVVFLNTGLHAREWIGPMTVMYLLKSVLDNLALPSSSSFASYEWQLILISNPDGYVYSWLTDRLWRKNRSPNPNGGASCNFGTDLNRNFNTRWGLSGTSTNPCSDVYQGSSAGSERETIVLQNHMRSISSRSILYCDVHSYASAWMSIFGYAANVYPPNYSKLMRALRAAKAAVAASTGLVVSIGTDADVLSAASGGSDDYAFDAGIMNSFTIELRGNSFVAPVSDIVLSGKEFTAGIIALANDLSLPGIASTLSASGLTLFLFVVFF